MTAVLALGALAASLAQAPALPRLNLTVTRATRLLVVAPHPDDGVLGAGGLIRRVISHGGRVRVVWTTSGDGFPRGVASAEGIGLSGAHLTPRDYQSYALIREHEARAALESLGVHGQSLTFLGFPDDGLCQLASPQPPMDSQAFRSPYTTRISPPPAEQIIRGVQYRGVDLRRELERVIAAFRPTLIVVPHPADEHPDHCSTHIFLDDAIERLAGQGWTRPHVLHYLIHYRGWPLDGDADREDLSPPSAFPTGEGRWLSLELTSDEAASKREAVLAHHSQLLVIRPFMLAFARTNELFLEGEPPAQKCWCNGENIATAATPTKGLRRLPGP